MASPHEPIAVIGMACRFPGGADTPESFWRVLHKAEPVPIMAIADRETGRTPRSDPDSGATERREDPHAALLDGIDAFDAPFFGLTPTEAAAMDPQHRLLLEVSWEALERAGQSPDRLAGTNTAVFTGIISPDYLHRQFQADPARLSPYAFTGGMLSMAAGRLSYLLDLRGPALAVESACSSSLLAVHHAVRQLRGGDSDLALAGGVNLVLLPELSTVLARMHALSADGRSRTFDAGAEGYGRAEGCGMVVFKRLSDARSDGDDVLAVIRGSAVNQDGRSSGITVPSQRAQADVIRAALADAGLDPLDVGYVECHGTGTAVGDPIEIAAIGSAVGRSRPSDRPLLVGSAKAVMGHSEAAAGVAGFIKAVLCVQHGEVPGQPVGELNPALELDAFRARIPRTTVGWPSPGRTRVAGVSAFGFSGTNVHVLLEQAPPEQSRPAEAPDRPAHLLALSANSADALRTLAGRYADRLREDTTATPADTCHTANTGRSHRLWRTALVAESTAELADGLADVAATGAGVHRAASPRPPRVAFLYSGQGAARVGMGRSLFDHEPGYRAAIEESDATAGRLSGRSLIELLYPRDTDGDGRPIMEAAVAQPALFAVERALTRLWASVGVAPDAVAGHSLGEYAAACAAGALSWEDGLRLCVERGRLVGTLPEGKGAMLAVFAPPGEVEQVVAAHGGRVEIAAYNGPEETVLSGTAEAIEELAEAFADRKVTARRLPLAHAFHSRLIDPILDRFEKLVGQVPLADPSLPFADNLTGALADEHDLRDAHRWRRHMREPVRYWDGVRTLLDGGITCFVEIGPDRALTGTGLRGAPEDASWLSSLRRDRDDVRHWLTGLGTLYTLGVPIDLSGLDRGRTRRRRVLPTYPFERRRLWLDGLERVARPGGHQDGTLPGRRLLSPASDAQFETVLDHDRQPFLADTAGLVHVGVYAEIAAACAHRLDVGEALELENLTIAEALVVPEDTEQTLHTLARAEPSGDVEVRVSALERETGDGGRWCEHARAVVRGRRRSVTERHDLTRLAETAVEQRTGEHLYRELRSERSLDLGPRVALVDHLWRIDDETMLARLRARPDTAFATGFDPGVLDACMQLFNALTPASAGLLLFMRLAALDLAAVARPVTGPLWARADIEHRGEREVRGRVQVLGDDGVVVASARDVVMRRTSAEVLARLGSARPTAPSAPLRTALETLREMAPDDARTRLVAEIREMLLPIVGGTEADLDDDEPLPTMGVDSIMATQLRNALDGGFGVSIPLHRVLDGASVSMLAADLAEALASGESREDDTAWQAGRV